MTPLEKQTGKLERTTIRKVTRRLIPFLFLLYIVAWLDRVNVGFAALQMNTDLGFSAATFGFGSGIFFLGYCLCEVPSNLVLERVGARLWIARIMVTWGLISVALMFVRAPSTLYLLRFLLGAAEAGFFPGIIYYLSLWYPAAQRARAIAIFMTAVPVTGLVGGPLSGALLGLNGAFGLKGWQWLFLLEGLPAIFLGVAVLFYLNDRPEIARWLAPPERDWLLARLAAERNGCQAQRSMKIHLALTDRTVWRLGFIFLLVATGFYGYSFWAPLVIKSLLGITNLGVGFVLSAISALTIIAMLANGAHSIAPANDPFTLPFRRSSWVLGLPVARSCISRSWQSPPSQWCRWDTARPTDLSGRCQLNFSPVRPPQPASPCYHDRQRWWLRRTMAHRIAQDAHRDASRRLPLPRRVGDRGRLPGLADAFHGTAAKS